MSWTITGATSNVSCKSKQEHYYGCMNWQFCCMPTRDDEFVITCADTSGNGWQDEYLFVNGNKICGGFVGTNVTTVMPNPIKKACETGRSTFR